MGGRRVDDLDRILRQLESRLGPMADAPQPLHGGITNRNYRVRLGEHDCVVRMTGKDTSLLGIDREAERLANQTGAELGIAPGVLDGGNGWLVTAYVEGTPADPAAVARVVEPVGRALRAFHDSGVGLPIRFWVPELMGSYVRVVRERGGSLPPAFADARRLAVRIAELLPLSDPVPCHNDLLPANVLQTGPGEVMLVDWEYAGMGHRLFDLGNLSAGAELDDAAETQLLGAYLERSPSSGERAALRLMRLMSDAREAAWGVVQAVVSELDFDFDGYAARHFDRLAAAARDPRLEEWLDAATA